MGKVPPKLDKVRKHNANITSSMWEQNSWHLQPFYFFVPMPANLMLATSIIVCHSTMTAWSPMDVPKQNFHIYQVVQMSPHIEKSNTFNKMQLTLMYRNHSDGWIRKLSQGCNGF
jgi:hypothetical protein